MNPQVRLGAATRRDPDGTTNIFPGIGDPAVVVAGWFEGDAKDSGAGDDGWLGDWGGKLYGTGADLPGTVAGTLNEISSFPTKLP